MSRLATPDDVAARINLSGPPAVVRTRITLSLIEFATMLLGKPVVTRYCRYCGEPFLVVDGRRLTGFARMRHARFCTATCRTNYCRHRVRTS